MGAIQKVNYEAGGQKVELTPVTVKQYLVSGDARAVSDQEVGMFLKICEGQKLNPFLREAYLVKYGSQPASIIVGKDTFTKRAESNDNYKGTRSGVIVINLNKQLENREGTFYLKNREELVGGWARVSFKNDKEDVFNTVSFEEYVQRKKDGTINSMWQSKPGTMIRKVALVQALREAFPSALSQMYVAEEIAGIDEELPTEPINLEDEQRQAAHVDELPKTASQLTKKQVMQLAAEKGLMTGDGKDADISKLEALCNENKMSLRGLTEDQATTLINVLRNYQEVQEVEFQEVQKPIKEDSEAEKETEIEDDPF